MDTNTQENCARPPLTTPGLAPADDLPPLPRATHSDDDGFPAYGVSVLINYARDAQRLALAAAQQPAPWQKCREHGPAHPSDWACPQCLRELRAENERLTAEVSQRRAALIELGQVGLDFGWTRAASDVQGLSLSLAPFLREKLAAAHDDADPVDVVAAHRHVSREEAITLMRAALPQQPVPPGYALVPLEITEDMHAAAVRTLQRCTGNADFPPRVWRAMHAAAAKTSYPLEANPEARASAEAPDTPLPGYWTNERCQYMVCDEEEEHDAKCTAWKLAGTTGAATVARQLQSIEAWKYRRRWTADDGEPVLGPWCLTLTDPRPLKNSDSAPLAEIMPLVAGTTGEQHV